jgi:hypothetical protein
VAHTDALFHGQARKNLGDLEGAGNSPFGDLIGRKAGDPPTVELDPAFISVFAHDQVKNG